MPHQNHARQTPSGLATFLLCCLVLCAALLFCGGTHRGFYADIGLELLAIPLLAAALWPAFSRDGPRRKEARICLAVTLIAAFAVFIEIIPLPFAYWREARGIVPGPLIPALASEAAAFSTLSLTPQASWAAGASLIPPLAIFGAVLHFDHQQRRLLSFLVLGFGAVSLILGFLQVLQGETSALRFYEFTNPSDAVGFFANRNHFAALLNVTLVLAAYWLFCVSGKTGTGLASTNRIVLWLALTASLLVADFSGLAMARSRAGAVLAMGVLAGSVLMTLRTGNPAGRAERRGLGRKSKVALLVSVFALMFTAEFGLGGLLLRLETSPIDDLRVPLNQSAFETFPKVLPFGTGLGSFPELYAAVEKPENAFAGFANRAHNDLAEILLETGLIGALLLIGFLAWFLRQSYHAWGRLAGGQDAESLVLLRASTLILGVLLLHSLVDYPLRTGALGAVFACVAAILASPAPLTKVRPHSHTAGRRETMPAEIWQPSSGWPAGWQDH